MIYRNWSSFNSGKLFGQVGRWKHIDRNGEIPPPVLITVDPTNLCNLSCKWCNAWKIRQNQRIISRDTLINFANFVSGWKSFDGKYGVEAICIAGGGEPLCNPYVGEFLLKLNQLNIKVATVTNGTLIDKYLDELLVNQYVAVSVDAATSNTFNKYKGLSNTSNTFNKIIDNISVLCNRSRERKCNLGKDTLSNGINYRMLLYKDNIKEICKAAEIAQELGCNSLHIRPASIPYDGNDEFVFTPEEIELIYEQINIVNERKKPEFGFYYSLSKFNDKFQQNNDFERCYAIFMTATLMPPNNKGDKDAYCLNVCCDRRSDSMMRLLTNEVDLNKISREWGSKSHWDIFEHITKEQIDNNCPRCTYYEHNKIMENCIESDNMLINFI